MKVNATVYVHLMEVHIEVQEEYSDRFEEHYGDVMRRKINEELSKLPPNIELQGRDLNLMKVVQLGPCERFIGVVKYTKLTDQQVQEKEETARVYHLIKMMEG